MHARIASVDGCRKTQHSRARASELRPREGGTVHTQGLSVADSAGPWTLHEEYRSRSQRHRAGALTPAGTVDDPLAPCGVARARCAKGLRRCRGECMSANQRGTDRAGEQNGAKQCICEPGDVLATACRSTICPQKMIGPPPGVAQNAARSATESAADRLRSRQNWSKAPFACGPAVAKWGQR